MSIFEYDEEKHMRQEREENWAEGHRVGVEEGHRAGVEEGHRAGVEEGHRAGVEEGFAEGIANTKKIFKFHLAGRSNEEIAKECQIPLETVEEILS